MKVFKIVLALYGLFLLWVVLCKTSLDISSVLHVNIRSLNLIPFGGITQGDWRGIIDNVIIFVPFGLLLSVNFKQISLKRKLAFISVFSLGVEMLQFVLAIGVTDMTDVIANMFGGLVGLGLYTLDSKQVSSQKLDQVIAVVVMLLLSLFLLLRFLVFKVRY